MILVAFGWLVRWAIGSAVLLAIGWFATLIIQTDESAGKLVEIWLFGFNGILAGAAGYGVVFFLCREKHVLLESIVRAVSVPAGLEEDYRVLLSRAKSWPVTHVVAIVLTALGSYIAYRCGIPLSGFAHVYLSLAVFSFYFVGSYGLMVMVAVLRLFRFIEIHALGPDRQRISLSAPIPIRDIRTIDSFFVVSSTMAVLALYVCFRGTLTAFVGASPQFYKALIIPLFFFLPASLVYSFYPRFVLRQVWDTDTLVEIQRFTNSVARPGEEDHKSELEYRKLLLDVKEKMMAEKASLPLLSFKDAPTLSLALLMAIQLIASRDPIIARFFGLLSR